MLQNVLMAEWIKGNIARLNLKTGEVAKLTDDKTIGNMMMSPNGKVILINYRSDGYWSVFDVASRTEKRVNEINGYAHTNEIIFKGDYQVLTFGDTYMEGDVEMTGTKVIDLRTGKRIASYKECVPDGFLCEGKALLCSAGVLFCYKRIGVLQLYISPFYVTI